MNKQTYIVLGFGSFGLGTIGIYVPLLPTVPLYLASAYFFSKSSKRFYNWLMQGKRGKLIRQYQGEKIPLKAKLKAISLIAISFSITIYMTRSWKVVGILGITAMIIGYIFYKR